jgi:tRNA dimethylallyltransferase
LEGSSAVAIRVICGPTAAGKTFAAGWFAQHADLAVISADSRQLYRQFDIGTAKPSALERTSLAYYGVDVLDPTERASAAWWAERADAWIGEASAQGRVPVVVGGTGLYIRSLFGTLFEEPPLDAAERAAMQGLLDALGTDELRRWVAAIDPVRAHLGRTQLLRAIEIALLTGRRLSEWFRENARAPRRSARYLVVDPGPVLASTIAQRARTMLSNGWSEEVRALIGVVPEDAPAWNSTGYRAIREMEQGRLSAREAEDRVVIETRQYAKRQRTWFRHQLAGENVTRLSTEQPDWAERAMAWWRGGEKS